MGRVDLDIGDRCRREERSFEESGSLASSSASTTSLLTWWPDHSFDGIPHLEPATSVLPTFGSDSTLPGTTAGHQRFGRQC